VPLTGSPAVATVTLVILPFAAVTVTPRSGLTSLLPLAGAIVSTAAAADLLAADLLAAGLEPPVPVLAPPVAVLALPWHAAASSPATAQITMAGSPRRWRDEVRLLLTLVLPLLARELSRANYPKRG
jgi:hypothetical protein